MASPSSTKVVIVGGGPVGLISCLHLLEYGRRTNTHFDIHMYERRWARDEKTNKVTWKSWMDNNNRREQTVTLQSNVYSLFPKHIKEALFRQPHTDYVEMWAMGPDSLEENGYPRNIKIKRVEDVLLDLVQQPSSYEQRLRLDPPPSKPYTAPKLHLEESRTVPKEAFRNANFVVLADGGGMATEQALFPGVFGERRPFPEDPDLELGETVLGIYVEADNGNTIGLSEANTVLMTSAQNRFLLNPLGRSSGFLNMWLTPAETKVAVGIDMKKYGPVSCNQSAPCSFSRCADGEFRCSFHTKVMFWPSVASHAPERDDSAGAMLWSRILDGLKLYDIQLSSVKSFTTFRLGPFQQRSCFVRNLSSALIHGRLDLPFDLSNPSKNPYAAVIGDAAFPVSFRAGRGLNTGCKAAVSLARTLTAAAHQPRGWRMADFTGHEGFMASLQMREVACRSMQMMEVQNTTSGKLERVVDKIQEGIDKVDEINADTARDALFNSLHRMSNRLADRLPVDPPSLHTLQKRLYFVSDETVRVLYAGGPWNSVVVGGMELGPTALEPLWPSAAESLILYDDRHLTQRQSALLPSVKTKRRSPPPQRSVSPPKSLKPKNRVLLTIQKMRPKKQKENIAEAKTTDHLPKGSLYSL